MDGVCRCGIDFEGGSDGVSVNYNVIHDSYGAGIMVFGMSDTSRNISNASIVGNVSCVRSCYTDCRRYVLFLRILYRLRVFTCASALFLLTLTDSSTQWRSTNVGRPGRNCFHGVWIHRAVQVRAPRDGV